MNSKPKTTIITNSYKHRTDVREKHYRGTYSKNLGEYFCTLWYRAWNIWLMSKELSSLQNQPEDYRSLLFSGLLITGDMPPRVFNTVKVSVLIENMQVEE